MAESTLSVSTPDLRSATGRYLGYGTDYDAMAVEDQRAVDDCITRALRVFYFSSPGPSGATHQWSFLRPVGSLTTASGTWEYELPSECGGIEGDMTFVTSTGLYSPVPLVAEYRIRDQRARIIGQTGSPQMAAVRSKPHTGTKGQRLEVLFWPTPDAAYELEYRMVAYPNAITPDSPWPYGGAAHAQTLLQGCLAQAELHMDGTMGVQTEAYRQLLAASVSADSQLQRPEYLGYNGDRSDMVAGGGMRSDRMTGLRVTYNNTLY